MRSTLVRLIPVFCLMMLAGGCASTSLKNQWKNPTVTVHPYQKFLVVGVANDITLRRAYENLLTEDLQKMGADAVRSIEYLPQDRKPDKEQVKAVVRESGADAVIVTRVAKVKDETVYNEGFWDVGYTAGAVTSTSPGSDFSMFYAGVVATPMAQDVQTAILETRLFDATDGTLVWVATTSSFDSDRQFDAINDLAKLLAATLRKGGYLKPAP